MIKEHKKLKIPSIAELEQELLADSITADMELPDDTTQDAGRVLTAPQVRHDVSTVGRALINVYGGWPFLDDVEKRRILTGLNEVLKNAHDMTTGELFALLAPIIEKFRDNHISIKLNDNFVRSALGKPIRDVGKNLSLPNSVMAEMRGDIAIIAFKTLQTWNHQAAFDEFYAKMGDMLAKSSALIVDLRGNGGGNSRPTDELAYHLYGADVPHANKEYIRATPDSAIVHKRKKSYPEWLELNDGSGTVCVLDAVQNPAVSFGAEQPGYIHPIYVLIDRGTMSSAEMFCTKMRQHPYVKFVGDNTRGGEVFGNMAYCILPNSKIMFRFGCVYRELAQENFELNGYAPDIRVADGTDAFDVAMQDLAATRMLTHNKGQNQMKITFRNMTADEAWDYLLGAHARYHRTLKQFGYSYTMFIPQWPFLNEMFEIAQEPTPEQVQLYRNKFLSAYNESHLHRLDSVLGTVAVPTLHRVVETLTPFAKKWGVKFPDSVEILTTYGMGGSYEWGDNPKIIFRMTQYLDEYTPGLLLHEFIHLLIEQPIIQKYNVPQDLKERIVDIIGFEYFGRHVQSKYENSFANNYITRSAIENDLPGAVQKMMADYNGLQATKQQGYDK